MDIQFTRGDTQIIKFQLKDANNNLLELTDTDRLYFTVKDNSKSNKVSIQKTNIDGIEYRDGFYILVITSEDTSNLQYKDYQFDIEFKSGDFVKTLTIGTITLTEEITWRGDENDY